MKNTKKVGKELYENLGKLFYAIAMADSRVQGKEVSKLRSFIRTYWLEVDELEDEFGPDSAFQIESVVKPVTMILRISITTIKVCSVHLSKYLFWIPQMPFPIVFQEKIRQNW